MASILMKANLTSIVTPAAKFNNAGQSANGSSLKEVKARIKSVTSIRKITKTMNMIATARLKAAQARMDKARTFYSTVSRAFEGVPAPTEVKKALLIPITSDRGLCGAVNSQIVKYTKVATKEKEEKGAAVSIACIGEKAPNQLQRDVGDKILWHAGETSRKALNFLAVGLITDRLMNVQFDTATVIYNHFNSIISSSPVAKEVQSYETLQAKPEFFDQFEFEDDNTLFHVRDLVEYHLTCLLFAAFSEGVASELGGRMSSMDNATRNAGEMIKKLSIQYNRRRQAAITTELTEIISGASAIQ